MTLTEKYKEALRAVEGKDLVTADKLLDRCLLDLAKATEAGIERMEGTTVDIWKSRVWTTIEKAGLLPD